MSRPALLDKLFQAGKWLLKPSLVPVDDVTIKRNQTAVYVALDALIRQGGGLAVGSDKRIYVDFSLMPTDAFEELLKSIRVPIWLTKNTTILCCHHRQRHWLAGTRAVVRQALCFNQGSGGLCIHNVQFIQLQCHHKGHIGDYGREAIRLPSYSTTTRKDYYLRSVTGSG